MSRWDFGDVVGTHRDCGGNVTIAAGIAGVCGDPACCQSLDCEKCGAKNVAPDAVEFEENQ